MVVDKQSSFFNGGILSEIAKNATNCDHMTTGCCKVENVGWLPSAQIVVIGLEGGCSRMVCKCK